MYIWDMSFSMQNQSMAHQNPSAYFRYADARGPSETDADFHSYRAWRDGEGKYDGNLAVDNEWLKRREAWEVIVKKEERRKIERMMHDNAATVVESLSPVMGSKLLGVVDRIKELDFREGIRDGGDGQGEDREGKNKDAMELALMNLAQVLSVYKAMQAILSKSIQPANASGTSVVLNSMIVSPATQQNAPLDALRQARIREASQYREQDNVIDGSSIEITEEQS